MTIISRCFSSVMLNYTTDSLREKLDLWKIDDVKVIEVTDSISLGKKDPKMYRFAIVEFPEEFLEAVKNVQYIGKCRGHYGAEYWCHKSLFQNVFNNLEEAKNHYSI